MNSVTYVSKTYVFYVLHLDPSTWTEKWWIRNSCHQQEQERLHSVSSGHYVQCISLDCPSSNRGCVLVVLTKGSCCFLYKLLLF